MNAFFVIPGFLGTNMNNFVNFFKNDSIIYVASINGHTNNNHIDDSKNWVSEVYYQYKNFLEKNNNVFLVGFSMGGIISSYLLHYYNSYKVKGHILINPAFVYKNSIPIKDVKFNYKSIVKVAKKLNKGLFSSINGLNKLSNSSIIHNYLDYKKDTFIQISTKDSILKKDNLDYILSNIKSDYIIKYYDAPHDLLNSLKANEALYDILGFTKQYN